jgi:hypothetical protein
MTRQPCHPAPQEQYPLDETGLDVRQNLLNNPIFIVRAFLDVLDRNFRGYERLGSELVRIPGRQGADPCLETTS